MVKVLLGSRVYGLVFVFQGLEVLGPGIGCREYADLNIGIKISRI